MTAIKKTNITGRRNMRDVDPNWFTGRVWAKSISDVVGSMNHDIYHVHFESGSRTKLHSHNGGQTLMVTAGNGSLVTFEKSGRKTKRGFAIKRTKSVKLGEGDVVYIPPNVLHAHGSVSEDETFSHVAINLLPRKSSVYRTVWYESDFRKHVSGIV